MLGSAQLLNALLLTSSLPRNVNSCVKEEEQERPSGSSGAGTCCCRSGNSSSVGRGLDGSSFQSGLRRDHGVAFGNAGGYECLIDNSLRVLFFGPRRRNGEDERY